MRSVRLGCQKPNSVEMNEFGLLMDSEPRHTIHIDLVNKLKNKADEKELEQKIAELPKELTEGHYLEMGNRPWWIYYVLEDSPYFTSQKNSL